VQAITSSNDDGYIRDARVPASVSDRASPFGIGGRSSTATCCLQAQAAAPKLNRFDRPFWVVVRQIWTNWSEALILVGPETVISWHRRLPPVLEVAIPTAATGPKVTEEIRGLIRRMKRENPTWGAPRIHGELLALGFEISEPTVSRYLQRLRRIPEESKASQWLAFLNNRRELIAAFDFFTVPTLLVPRLILLLRD
jgi:hypothetical protein